MNEKKLGVLLIQDVVLFPNSEIRIESDNINDRKLISLAEYENNKKILVVNPLIDDSSDITTLPNIGVVAEIKLKIDVPNGKTRIVLLGLERVAVDSYLEDGIFFKASIKQIDKIKYEDEDVYKSILIKSLEKYINLVPYISNEIVSKISMDMDLNEMCDLIGAFLPLGYTKKKKYILESNQIIRAKNLISDMNEDLKIIELERDLDQEVEQELSKTQKEFYLREKVKIIQKELGDVNSKEDELTVLKNKLSKIKCNNKVKEKIKKEINRYEATNSNSPELGIIRDYLDWMLNLPWNKTTKDNTDLAKIKEVLDNSHYALDDVKERILEYIAVKQNTNNLRSPIICLVGPPGVGKTSLAISIANSLGRKYCKMSVGGINDEAEIVGHRRTYIGANPGRVIQGIRKAATSNPVFIIDEIDKMRKDIKGDPASSLLEVLDPEQNKAFSDHYIEEEFDLSKVMFIATANYLDQIPLELRDRLEIIEVSSYSEYEKFDIAKNYIIPKAMDEHNLTQFQISFTDEVIFTLIRYYTKEAGVRELSRVISSILRKVVKKFLMERDAVSININDDNIEEILGHKKYFYTEKSNKKQVGIVNGMAYMTFGGDILPIEVTKYSGKGDLILTGSLGDVMKESARLALSYIKANSRKIGISKDDLKESDIHIHVPEGAVPKDGPSAGIALTTALISLFTNKAVDCNISMTGEITLRGNILPIGGVREKVIGAHRSGIKTIYLPKENKKDLEEIPKEVVKSIKFIFVTNYDEVYEKIFKSRKILVRQ